MFPYIYFEEDIEKAINTKMFKSVLIWYDPKQ